MLTERLFGRGVRGFQATRVTTNGRSAIGAHEVRVWWLRPDQQHAALERPARVLSAYERCRAERFASDADRRRCMAEHGRIRMLPAHDTGGVRALRGAGDQARSGLRAPGAAA